VFSALRPSSRTASPRASSAGGGSGSSNYGKNNNSSRSTLSSIRSSSAPSAGARKEIPAKGVASSDLGTPLDSCSALAALAERYHHENGDEAPQEPSSPSSSSTLDSPTSAFSLPSPLPPEPASPQLPSDDQAAAAVGTEPAVTHLDGTATTVDDATKPLFPPTTEAAGDGSSYAVNTSTCESLSQADDQTEQQKEANNDEEEEEPETLNGGVTHGRRNSLRGDATALEIKDMALEVSSSTQEDAVDPSVDSPHASKGDAELSANASDEVDAPREQASAFATGVYEKLSGEEPSTSTVADAELTTSSADAGESLSSDATASHAAGEPLAAPAATTNADAPSTTANEAPNALSSTTMELAAPAADFAAASTSEPLHQTVDSSTVPPMSVASVPPAPPLASPAAAAEHALPEKWLLAEKGNRGRALQRY